MTGAVNSSQAAALAFRGVGKAFGPTQALDRVSFDAYWGTVHAVTGENGAGKSTLMKLLAGVFRPSTGKILLAGQTLDLRNPAAARKAGISTVFQELTVLPNLTVAENMFLGREPGGIGGIDARAMRKEAAAVLGTVGLMIDVDAVCGDLTIAEQQMVEIAKGLSTDARIFIFDEPTAALNAHEVGQLTKFIGELRAQGKLIFYISHRLKEIFALSDTVTVLKDGRHVATVPAGELDPDQLVHLMVGRELEALFPERKSQPAAADLLDVKCLQIKEAGPEVQFQLRRGEIVSLYGLEGQGQREIIRCLTGVNKPHLASITLVDRSGAARSLDPALGVAHAVEKGVGFIPEDRKAEGLYLSLSIKHNIGLGLLRGVSILGRAPSTRDVVRDLAESLKLRAASVDQPVGSLSGGNQQKVMLGRWLAAKMDVLLVEEPTRGVDVGAKVEIYRLLREFADDGGAVLLVSSDLPEVLGLSDRILVVREGQIVGQLDGGSGTEQAVMAASLGTNAVTAESVA